MIKNYFKTALRNLWRHKGFSIINITSLAIGIIGCLVIALFVYDEKQYDRIPGGENIYRVYEERTDNNSVTYVAVSPPAFATFLKHQYAEVDTTARILMSSNKFLMEAGGKENYEDKGWFVDPSFFAIFPLTFAEGDPATALTDPLAIVITKELAEKYFAKESAIGKTIKIDKEALTVKGVMQQLPGHFHLDFNYLMPLQAAGLPKDRMDKWTWHQFYTYVKLKPGTDAKQLQHKFQAYVKQDIFPTLTQAGSTFLPFFQPLKDIHLRSADFVYDNAVRGNETYVTALSVIVLFVLVIACFNFINLSTARSFKRAKEIGVRKVVGASRKQLIFQFLEETVFVAFLAMLIAMIVTFFILPELNDFTGKNISFNPFTDPVLGLAMLGATLIIGVLAGVYPALVLSGFQPIKVLKNIKFVGSSGSAWLRQGLVVLQFSLSILLIVSTIIVFRQTVYLNQKDLGFNRQQVLYFQVRDSLASNPQILVTFKNELKRSANVLAVTSGYGLPGDRYAGDGITLPTKEGEKELPANVFIGDEDYVKTLGLKIIAGRDFSKDLSMDAKEAFLINETAVKEWGFQSPEKALGRPIYWKEWVPSDSLHTMKKGKVIGVVQDFHYKSLHEKVTASVIQLYPQVSYTVAVKLKTGDMQNTIAFIRNTWDRFSPRYPLEYKFMDESYSKMYSSEEKLSDLLWIFTVMAIFIGCMGLFGLAAFSTEQRTKEIGIRKVLGANMFNIMTLLSGNFLLLILISSVIAFPVAWWAMSEWLRDFPYRVSISWWVFGIAILSALFVAFVTISFQSVKAARVNPVKSLRAE